MNSELDFHVWFSDFQPAVTFAVDWVLSIKHLPIGDKKSKWTGCGKAAGDKKSTWTGCGKAAGDKKFTWTGCGKAASAARAPQPHLAAAYSVLMVASRDIAGNCKNLVTHCFMKDV